MKKNLIYGLYCPFTDDIHYVGKSSVGMIRPLQHLSQSHSPKINEWVSQLSLLGYSPIVKILEECNEVDIDIIELRWIDKLMDSGAYLLNVANNKTNKITSKPQYSVNTLKKIGVFLKKERRRLSYSSEEVSKVINISRTTLSAIENGTGNTRYSILDKILSLYGYEFHIKKINKEVNISKLAIKFVEFCNADMGKWDTKMYREKEEFIRIINKLI